MPSIGLVICELGLEMLRIVSEKTFLHGGESNSRVICVNPLPADICVVIMIICAEEQCIYLLFFFSSTLQLDYGKNSHQHFCAFPVIIANNIILNC